MSFRPMGKLRPQAGFSLIELVVVVSVAAVVMAVLTPGIRQTRESFDLRRAATLVASEMRRAQALATAEGADYTVEFDVVSGSETSNGLKTWKQGVSSPVRTVMPPEWPRDIQIVDGPSDFPVCTTPADTSNDCAVWKPLGYPLTTGGGSSRVRLKTKGSASQLEVVVQPATGKVSVERP